MEEVTALVDNIPLILQYIVPGYCCIKILCFSLNKRLDLKTEIIISCIISYALLSLFSLIKIVYFNDFPNNVLANSAICILIGITISTILERFIKSKIGRELFVYLYNQTINENIWGDIIDYKNGSNLKIYIRDEEYYVIGHFKNHEINKEDCWFALSSFGKYNKTTNQPYNNEQPFNKDNIIYTVRLSDIEHIEVFNKES